MSDIAAISLAFIAIIALAGASDRRCGRIFRALYALLAIVAASTIAVAQVLG
mgnify:FL=1